MRETCDKLLTLYRRVSLDEDLDDNTRQELMTMMTEGSSTSQAKLRQISVSSGICEDTRSKDEIASAAMENIRRFLSQNSKCDV